MKFKKTERKLDTGDTLVSVVGEIPLAAETPEFAGSPQNVQHALLLLEFCGELPGDIAGHNFHLTEYRNPRGVILKQYLYLHGPKYDQEFQFFRKNTSKTE